MTDPALRHMDATARLQEIRDLADVLREVRIVAKSMGGQKALAERAGISAAYVSDMMCGNRPFSDALLRACGIKRVVTMRYERIG